jgi:hypothetical protein
MDIEKKAVSLKGTGEFLKKILASARAGLGKASAVGKGVAGKVQSGSGVAATQARGLSQSALKKMSKYPLATALGILGSAPLAFGLGRLSKRRKKQ